MSEPSGGVSHQTVAEAEDGLRLDKWFAKRYPTLGFGALQKMLRTGQVRLDGKRAKAADRISVGQDVRVPPLPRPADGEGAAAPRKAAPPPVSDADAEAIRKTVIYKDDLVLAINKPPGLAVQGGSKMIKHLDAMLDALKFEKTERPKLVHRLDKDTSGVLVLARTGAAAAKLTAAFQSRTARKLYWALVIGGPKRDEGKIDAPVEKLPGRAGEKVVVDQEHGKKARTYYRVVARALNKAAWVALEPKTGRTHQLRVHMAFIGHPIVGDGKYGGAEAHIGGMISRKLHLHARALRLPHPNGGTIEIVAPLPEHMERSFETLGFDQTAEGSAFKTLD